MKRLTRSRNDKVLFGVCGGVGKYFDIDPVIIRIIFLVLLFTAGVGFLAYIIAIFIIPEDDKSYFNKRYTKASDENSISTNNEKMEKGEISNNVPEELSEDKKKSSNRSSEITGTIIGITLIVFGVLFLMRNFSFLNHIYYSVFPVIKRFFWPGILIGLGALVIYKNKNN